MTSAILCVDDEPRILEAFERQLRKQFDVHTALGPDAALNVMASQGPYAVVVSDLRMPGMDGIEFLSRVRQISPDTVRIMLTGNADLSSAVMAVNEGNIFQFLTKPCPGDMLVRTLTTALKQYELITAERELLEHTLQGSIGILMEILALVNPTAFSRTHRIRRYVREIAEYLKLDDRWQYELAATLSHIGCVSVPPEIMEKAFRRQRLTAEEQEVLSSQGAIGRRLLVKIPRLTSVAEMVAQQELPWPETGTADPMIIGAHLLRVVLDFDDQVQQGKSLAEARANMFGRREYNPRFVDALRRIQVDASKNRLRLVSLNGLKPGMTIESDLYSKSGVLLLAKGHEVTESAIARLESFASLFGIAEPISVIVLGADLEPLPNEHSADFSDALVSFSSRLGGPPQSA